MATQAQTPTELRNTRVDELTVDQVRALVLEANKQNISDEQMEQLALQQGMSPVEWTKLKTRMLAMRKAMGSPEKIPVQVPSADRKLSDSLSAEERKPLAAYTTVFSSLLSKNFGAEIFSNPRLTFEPNLRVPTPPDYMLAANDELLIDVSGYSEASYKLIVSPEGLIRFPLAGPVNVNGLTIEQAKRAIRRKLAATIYSDINTGRTFVDVYLGAIRSIKVVIIGEATLPGTYTLPSLATAYNALYVCGGPNANGSYRDIQVVRNNKTVAVIDVYEYLVNGNKKNDIRLRDQDVIKINTYAVRIELKGEVKKPGVYDVAPGETLEKIFSYAGGYTDHAYTARIQVFKNTARERSVSTISGTELAAIAPQKGDTYIVDRILNRFTNRISIGGAVYRPGEFELKNNMTLTRLITEADGLREDAFTSRAIIHRLKDDLSPEIVSVDLANVLNGNITDIPLRREDRVHIYSKLDIKEGYFVSIQGEVSAPGVFLYEEGISVQDLVLMAGGLKESASLKRVEISRRMKDADPTSDSAKTAIIFQQDIQADLKDSSQLSKLTLQPFDEVVIRPSPGYYEQKNVVIEGEVLFAGKYTLQTKSDRISDLVKRAGGITPQAYLMGAVLIRSRNFTKTEQSNYEQGLNNLLVQNYVAGTSPVLLENQLQRSIRKRSDLVGIDLQKIMDNPQSRFDLLLNDGDTLRIPRQLQTIRVNGEVLYPALVRYDRNLRFKDYILGAGGFSDRSAKKRSYVVYANGAVRGTRSFLFFKNYPELSPGAEIYVPVKRERERLRTGEVITIGGVMISMLAILINVL